jgi:hypothetical protein
MKFIGPVLSEDERADLEALQEGTSCITRKVINTILALEQRVAELEAELAEARVWQRSDPMDGAL